MYPSTVHAIDTSRVHTTKQAQVYVMSTLQGQIANVDTNLGRAHDST